MSLKLDNELAAETRAELVKANNTAAVALLDHILYLHKLYGEMVDAFKAEINALNTDAHRRKP
jgi:hypothetical protein